MTTPLHFAPTPPTVPGWYWYRARNGAMHIFPVTVRNGILVAFERGTVDGTSGYWNIAEYPGYWAGPIPIPNPYSP